MSVGGAPDERIVAIAALQRGRANRRQLLAGGVASGAIGRRVRNNRLIPVARGVYAVGLAAAVPLAPETEALLGLREGGCLGHLSSLWIWELIGEAPPEIHITVVGSAAGRLAGVRVHRVRWRRGRDLRIRSGLPVTSPSRALAESSPLLTDREFERAVEEGIRRRLTSESELREQLTRGTLDRSARRRLTRLLRDRRTPTFTRSEAEEVFLALLREAGLILPLCNVRRHGYEIDFLWPDLRLAVEIDGWAVHSSPEAFRRDRRKDADLWQRGAITVVRLTWTDITRDHVATVARIAQMLGHAVA